MITVKKIKWFASAWILCHHFIKLQLDYNKVALYIVDESLEAVAKQKNILISTECHLINILIRQ